MPYSVRKETNMPKFANPDCSLSSTDASRSLVLHREDSEFKLGALAAIHISEDEASLLVQFINNPTDELQEQLLKLAAHIEELLS